MAHHGLDGKVKDRDDQKEQDQRQRGVAPGRRGRRRTRGIDQLPSNQRKANELANIRTMRLTMAVPEVVGVREPARPRPRRGRQSGKQGVEKTMRLLFARSR